MRVAKEGGDVGPVQANAASLFGPDVHSSRRSWALFAAERPLFRFRRVLFGRPDAAESGRVRFMQRLVWGMLLGLTQLGCADGHVRSDAGTEPDATSVDAAFVADAGIADSGPPAHESLVVLREEDDQAVLIEVDHSGVTQELARLGLRPDESASSFVPGPTGDFGLLVTAPPSMHGSRRSVHLVSLGAGPITSVYAAIDAREPEGPCGDPSFSEIRWSSDGRSVFTTCEATAAGSGDYQRRAYHVDVGGEVTRLGGECSGVMVTTDDGRALILDGETCGTAASAALIDPGRGSRRELAALGEHEIVHFWDPTLRGFVASTVTERALEGGSAFELSNLRWFSEDGTRGEVLLPSLPFVPVVLAPSPDGDVLLIAERAPESGTINGIHIHGLHTPSETPVSLPDGCSHVFGVPEVQWAPDGRRFYLTCREGSWIVDRDGSSVPITPATRDRMSLGLDWSADSTRILRHAVVAGQGALVDPLTGASDDLPRAVRELDPRYVTWRLRPRRPDCGALTECR